MKAVLNRDDSIIVECAQEIFPLGWGNAAISSWNCIEVPVQRCKQESALMYHGSSPKDDADDLL